MRVERQTRRFVGRRLLLAFTNDRALILQLCKRNEEGGDERAIVELSRTRTVVLTFRITLDYIRIAILGTALGSPFMQDRRDRRTKSKEK